jgi:thiosulfate reductase cytochrome b subunit
MKQSTKRSILRWIHLVFAIPILGYVYSPFENIPQYAAPTRYVFFPVLVLTGLWMWKGQAIGRFLKRSPDATSAE